jgi:hypothetical protein
LDLPADGDGEAGALPVNTFPKNDVLNHLWSLDWNATWSFPAKP